MIPGLDALLAQKYSIQRTTANANANLANTQASVIPGDAAARQALEKAQADATGTAAGQIPLDSMARRAEEAAQTGLAGAETFGREIQNGGTPGGYAGQDYDDHMRQLMPGFHNGTANVPARQHFSDGAEMVSGGIPNNGPPEGGIQGPPIHLANGTPFVPGLNDGMKLQGAPGPGMIGPNAGTWGSAPAPTPNQDLRASMAGKMTTKNYNEGATKVPGQGDGTVDKVPAMLAPGEAVLNKGAAEHFGRDKIAALNSIGHAKMQAAKGQPQPGGPPQAPAAAARPPMAAQAPGRPAGGPAPKPAPKAPAKAAAPAGKAPSKPMPFKGAKPQELSKGTHHVGVGKSAKTPTIDPGAMQALAGMMGGGGGGMTPPGGAPPMAGPGGPPQPMPPGRGMV